MPGQKTGSGNVCRMLGVCLYVRHGRDYGCQNDVPILAGVFVEADFDGFEYFDLFGEGA